MPSVYGLPSSWIIDTRTLKFSLKDGLDVLQGSFEAFATSRPTYYPAFYLYIAGKSIPVRVIDIRFTPLENGWALECEFEERLKPEKLSEIVSISLYNATYANVVDVLSNWNIYIDNLLYVLGETRMTMAFEGSVQNFMERFARALGYAVRWGEGGGGGIG